MLDDAAATRTQRGDPARPARRRRAVSDEVRALVGAFSPDKSGVGPTSGVRSARLRGRGGARARAAAARVVQPVPRHASRRSPARRRRRTSRGSIRSGFVKYGTQTWIDPGDPAARKYVLETMLDVVKRYDVDGIHLDDYFYPYRETRTSRAACARNASARRVEIPFPDDKTWKQVRVGHGFTDRDAWRRANIDDFVHALYTRREGDQADDGRRHQPVRHLASRDPARASRDSTRSARSTPTRDAGSREGWLDYLAPQLYWQVGGTQDRFRAARLVVAHRESVQAATSGRASTRRTSMAEAIVGRRTRSRRRSRDSRRARRFGGSAGPRPLPLGALFADNDRIAHSLAARVCATRPRARVHLARRRRAARPVAGDRAVGARR